jgi:hypothetical protein
VDSLRLMHDQWKRLLSTLFENTLPRRSAHVLPEVQSSYRSCFQQGDALELSNGTFISTLRLISLFKVRNNEIGNRIDWYERKAALQKIDVTDVRSDF